MSDVNAVNKPRETDDVPVPPTLRKSLKNRHIQLIALGGAIGVALASLAIFPFNTLIGRQLELPYLQSGVWNVMLLIAVSFVFAVITGVIASIATAVKLSAPETYLTLREGE